MTEPADARPLRVLFVEDNEYLREVIAELLEEEALEVVSCASAESALDAFAAGRFDLVITDVSLPGMSGTELARRLRTMAPELWIVFSSGYPLDQGLAQFGARVRSLPKPFEIEALQGLLAHIRSDFRAPPVQP